MKTRERTLKKSLPCKWLDAIYMQVGVSRRETYRLVLVIAATLAMTSSCSKRSQNNQLPDISSGGPSSESASQLNTQAPAQSPSNERHASQTGTPARNADGATQGIAPTPPMRIQNCFLATYHHKADSNHSSNEACSRHKNLIRLKHQNINKTSLCIKVNNTPVKYQWVPTKNDEVIVAALAGPKSKITARYCIGKTNCADDCTIPRDEFLDAIGGSGETSGLGQWEADNGDNPEKLNNELKKELAELDAESGDGLYTFNDWISENTEQPMCGKKHALTTATGEGS